jgi:hypothetical protein
MKYQSLVLVSVLLLVGCASSTPTPVTDVNEIIGDWTSNPAGQAIRILPDGSVPSAVTLNNINAGDLACNGYTFSFDGGLLNMQGGCGCEDTVGSYEVQLLANGNLDFIVVEDDCLSRATGFVGQTVEPVKDIEWIKAE